MAVSHSYLGLLGLLFISSSLVMLWFVILSGVTSQTPLDKTFFLRANTSGITASRPISQWTFFYVCGDGNADCGPPYPALPVGWAWGANPQNAPPNLVGSWGGNTTSHYYWFMWRFGWVFYLMTLFFVVLAFFSGFLACFGRLGSAISASISLIALVLYTVGISLMTATFVKMRNSFNSNGRDAEIGSYAFGFSWGAWAALLIATILFCLGVRGNGNKAGGGGGGGGIPGIGGLGWGRARRRRSTRSRRSFDMGGPRVKEEYS